MGGHEHAPVSNRGTRLRSPTGQRLPMAVCFALLLLSGWARTGSAYEFSLAPTAPISPLAIGETIAFDVFLDTQGESAITGFSASISFDDERLGYRPDASEAAGFVLRAPGPGKAPSSQLTPFRNPPRDAPDFVGLEDGQVRVEFLVSPPFAGSTETGAVRRNATTATSTRAWLATLTFEALSPGTSPVDIGLVGRFDSLFTIRVGDEVVDIRDQIGAVGSTRVTIIPEPTTALLVATGLGGFALHRRNRRD